MANKNLVRNLIAILFTMYVISSFIGVVNYLYKEKNFSAAALDNYFYNNINYQEPYINLYGGIQKILDKKSIENFTIFKNSYDKLVAPREALTNHEIEEKYNQIKPVIDYLNNKNVPYVYMTSMIPIQSQGELPYEAVEDYSKQNAEKLLSILENENINMFNIRENIKIEQIPDEDRFYRTDHHWSMESCFTTYCELVDYLRETYGVKIDNACLDVDNFDKYLLENSFLGSYGVKVGKYYNGKDDFIVYQPLFKTNLLFEAYDSNNKLVLEKKGDWFNCLMDDKCLLDGYDNKYWAFSNGGFVDNRVINNNAVNGLKILYISHSYGRPLTQYLALCFQEVRNIDPQEGRFVGNYLDYIDEYNPDIVIFQIEFEGEIVGNYLTER